MLPLQELKTRLLEINDLQSAASLMHWDQATYMPQGGSSARGRQGGTLSRLAHEKLIDARIGELLETLRPMEDDPTSDDAALIRVSRRVYEKAARVPSEFEARLSDHTAETYQAWTLARPANDWPSVRPLLEKTLDLSRELSGFFPDAKHVADPLIDFSDPGMTTQIVRELFAQLRARLVPLVQEVTSRAPWDDTLLKRGYAPDSQLEFSRQLAAGIGYDFTRGRMDLTHHPFMTKFSLGDVRITNRVDEQDLGDALFGTLHEAGHALYEQGINPEYEGTPLGEGTSSGVHESQSRLWENLVGRSRGFWTYWFPRLQQVFPSQLADASAEEFYRAINRVQPSLIRTDADELTYNLHVMIRFDLEVEMLEGKLEIKDLPDAWRARYQADLGVSSEDDKTGCLQDVHWFGGTIGGAFQGYTLGNILSAQFYDAAVRALPDIPQQIERGEFAPLRAWLTENIYQYGAKYTAAELVQRTTGEAMSIEPYLRYLTKKYRAA